MAGNGETSVQSYDRAGGSTLYAPYIDPNSPVNAEKNETMHMTLHTHSDVSTINTSTVTDTMQNSIPILVPTVTGRTQPNPEIMSRSINQEYHRENLPQNPPSSPPPVEDVTDVSDNEELRHNYVQPDSAVLSDEPPELGAELDSTKSKEPAATINYVGSSATPFNSQQKQSCQTRISSSQHAGTSKQGKIVMPHKCEQCGKMLSSKLMLEAHVKCHRDSVGAKCEICQAELKHKKNLSRHMRTLHSKETLLVPCDKCSKKFKTKDALTHHSKVVHDIVKKVSCEICGRSYKRKKDLNRHQSNKH
ncbi:uncharacterized protein LOC102807133 [Saccoglossus kowalevskii]|uniref:Zinc finger protein 737-like n=1 Tax=Saccoglossus kowalevskii TaxID=10224 RepID=A0ABM0M2Z5_SACKO|nr:PREDICTED: zinc finger protein 737-like [Saccoglossus kowalevskii]